jgi:hypothetical protein
VSDDDVIQGGSGRPPLLGWRPPRIPKPGGRPPRIAIVLGAAGLLAGLAAGYAFGTWQAVKPAPARPQATAAAQPVAPIAGSPLGLYGPECSRQIGDELQLGVQVSNDTPTPLVLQEVNALLPLGGLREVSWASGTCGELPGPPPDPGLAPGNSLWFTVTFRVLVNCPAPLPVGFDIGYSQGGRHAVTSMPAFPDLGQVPYSGCR